MRNEMSPQDRLAEKSLLSCILNDTRALDYLEGVKLSRSDFYVPSYGIIFSVIEDVKKDNLNPDYVTVLTYLDARHETEKLNDGESRGKDVLINLTERFISSANVTQYAKIVKDKSILRELIRFSGDIAQESTDFIGEMRDHFGSIEKRLLKITQGVKQGATINLKSAMQGALHQILDFQKGNIGLTTGFSFLDRKIGGMRPGQLFILAARPGMGKTTLALNIAMNSYLAKNLPVIFFSLEMLANELAMRMICSHGKIPFSNFVSGSQNKKHENQKVLEATELQKSINELSSCNLFVNDDGGTSLYDIQSESRRVKSQFGLGLIVIDYVQLMRPATNNPSREQQISEISRGLKSLAKELEVPIIALSQLNRGVEGRQDKRPSVADLRESGSLEQDADVVMLIYRDEVYFPDSKDKGIAEVIVGKNRSGETGAVRLSFRGDLSLFSNLEENRYENP